MQIEKIKEIILKLRPDIETKYNVKIMGIFGSFVKGKYNQKSDIDILVNFNDKATLFDLIGLSIFLQEKLKREIDIVPIEDLREEIKENILKEVVYL
jgi:hypothetical protein